LPKGIILKGIGGFYYVEDFEKKDDIYECRARGLFRKDNIVPLSGDVVDFTVIDQTKKQGWIDKIYERKSELVRPAVANVDQMIAVISVKSPEPDLMLLDKLLVCSQSRKIHPVICINKIDLEEITRVEGIADTYRKASFTVVCTSAKLRGEGIETLKDLLRGRITVFAGQSGVGKSTLMNAIFNKNIMEVGDVSGKIERGRHTTRHAQLVRLENEGYVVDTPGFSSFSIEDIDCFDLQNYYYEFDEYKDGCRFSPCSHIAEPECKVREAVDKGLINSSRYNRYCQLFAQLKNKKPDWEKAQKNQTKRPIK